MFEQAVLPIQNEETFQVVFHSLEQTFSQGRVEEFLRRLHRTKLRARQFEAILASGLLGSAASGAYAQLGDSDRGHVRERYLSMVEAVAPALRTKFFKAYAYY